MYLKKISLVVVFISFITLGLFAEEKQRGISLECGASCSFMTFFSYESVSFKFGLSEKKSFDFEAGVKFSENYLFDPYFYYAPFIQLDYSDFYWAFELLNSVSHEEENIHKPAFMCGAKFAKFDMPGGYGRINVGMEFSPTRYFDPMCKYPGSKILNSDRAWLVNLIKINVGLNLFLGI